ncbi:MAG: DUF2796 domain-containing protein [Sneathiellaceae bacterium]
MRARLPALPAIPALLLAIGLLAVLPPSPAGAAAGNHRHGTGSLVITFQDPALTLDLTLPAVDIVGFEHAPRVDEHYTDIAQASATFRDPAQIVALPAAAGCEMDRAEAEFVALEQAAGGPHSAFAVLYDLSCANPSRLTGISFPLFGLFPSLTRLDVRLVAGGAHRDVTVTPDRPRLDLTR